MKKMRRRFIVAAMTAFGTVMLVLVTVINIVNYCQTTRRQDELAENLLSHERSAYAEPQKPPPPFAAGRAGIYRWFRENILHPLMKKRRGSIRKKY